MSEDSLYKLIDELKENGVSAEVSELKGGKNGEIQKVLGISVKLDFSEHDKVFEDKIAELKKDYKTVSGLLGKYQQENESLKQRVIELENFSCQAEQETEFLVEELKQRIAELESKNNQLTESILRKETKIHELESKETEKPTKCTAVIVAKEINGQTYVTLDDFMSVVNDLQAEIGTLKCKECCLC